jgi:hypothetical protein
VCARVPALDLYNRHWRIRSAQRDYLTGPLRARR